MDSVVGQEVSNKEGTGGLLDQVELNNELTGMVSKNLPQKDQDADEHGEDDDSDMDNFVVQDSDSDSGSEHTEAEGDDSDWESDDDDETVVRKEEEKKKNYRVVRHAFLPDHPLYLTHAVHCNFRKFDCIIPNFLGGAVPRSDKGNRDYYCLTMMTLFKVWRSPDDLKDSRPGTKFS
ncbi:hypothetical protein B0H17DRAFT_1131114 [Mycena rosella]|uniref:Uncharacterized protein n=1 Tax=Mycena rosella TaxID=1033263 RepID=A0AAD7DQK0_MYCRO|nr:hypothetical protein B0H17DRAFT_1131114 [Mycena rosella]